MREFFEKDFLEIVNASFVILIFIEARKTINDIATAD